MPGGKNPFLFYVVYGRVDFTQSLSRSKYRCTEIPDGIEVMSYGPQVHPDVVSRFRNGYVWDQLAAADAKFAAAIKAQDNCLVLRGEISDPPTLNYLRNVIGFLTFCLDAGGVAIYDLQILKWWTPSDWRSRILAAGSSALHDHAVILLSEEAGGTQWIHTRGMRKFGRPDLSIHNVLPQDAAAVVELCNRFIEFFALGGIVAEGQDIRMGSLPSGLKCFYRGDEDDPDFNNAHIEIAPADGA